MKQERVMRVRELMTCVVHTCRPQDSLEAVARLFWEHDCGVLPVLDAEGRVGAVITDRDVCMGSYTRGRRLADLRVADSMSKGVVTCRPTDSVAVAAEAMAAHQVRRLPVVDDDGKLCGLLSLNDLAVASVDDARLAREALKVLVASCSPRSRLPATEAMQSVGSALSSSMAKTLAVVDERA